MNTDSIVTFLIFSLVLVLMILIIKTCLVTRFNIKISNRSYIKLQQQIDIEEKRNNVNQFNIQLSDQFNETLIERLFIIIKDILFVQKLIFGKHDK